VRVAGSPEPRVTIADVARLAGVRPSTVSKVLNDGRGSPDVRRRVEAAVAQLDYRPNRQARGLRRSESRSIGVFVPDLANPVFLPFLRGVEQVAHERGYVVLIADGQRSAAAQEAALERFFDQGVDGLILAGSATKASLDMYVEHGVPVAPSVADYDRGLARHWEQGEAQATRDMATRLIELGHRRVAFVSPPAPQGQQGRRLRQGRLGNLAMLFRDANAQVDIHVVDPARGADAARDDLRAVAESHVTAFVCGSHLLAPWLLLALDDSRIRLPRDASLVVYGDSDWARAYRPALSVVSRDTYAEGMTLATWLLDTLAGADVEAPAGISSAYVERRSTGRPRALDDPGPSAR
jgi:LacI family transcriptional regulator